MNLELKSGVLEKSITIENSLSQILRTLLDMEKSDNKSLGHKGTALSFKTKADLLYDLDKISKETYTELLIFMEVRNQFIHNSDTNSFEIVLERIGKKNPILKIYNEKSGNSDFEFEQKYRLGFNLLSIKLLEQLHSVEKSILEQKAHDLKEKIEDAERKNEAEMLELSMKYLSDSIDEATEMFNKQFKEAFNYDRDIGTSIRTGIQGLFKKKWDEELVKRNES